MSEHLDDVVKIGTGTLVQVEIWQQVLADAGVKGRLVGDDLTPGVGAASAVELWVSRADAEKAAAAIRYAEEHKGHRPPREHGPHGPVASDPKPPAAPGHKEHHQNPGY